MKILQILECDANRAEFLEWCSRWCSQNNVWLLIAAQRSQTSYDLRLLIVTRTNETVCWPQSRDATRDDYSSDSSVRLLLSEDWFTCINWLELEMHLIVIQTNRCFIKSRIRDLLCIWRFSIEILNDYRISLIHDLFLIFTVFELEICEILLITSSDEYIEVYSLRSEHQCRAVDFSSLIWIIASRLFDSDLNRYNIFKNDSRTQEEHYRNHCYEDSSFIYEKSSIYFLRTSYTQFTSSAFRLFHRQSFHEFSSRQSSSDSQRWYLWHRTRQCIWYITRIERDSCCNEVTVESRTMNTSNCERIDQLFRLKRLRTKSRNFICYYCIHFTSRRADITKNSIHDWYFSSKRLQ